MPPTAMRMGTSLGRGTNQEIMGGDAYTQRGLYLRVRFKFDENVFGHAACGRARLAPCRLRLLTSP